MAKERLAKQSFWLHPQESGTEGRPKTRWRDYITDLAWSRLGVEPAELSEIAGNHEVFRVLGLLLRDS